MATSPEYWIVAIEKLIHRAPDMKNGGYTDAPTAKPTRSRRSCSRRFAPVNNYARESFTILIYAPR